MMQANNTKHSITSTIWRFKMSLYNPMFKWMNPRESGLICFKGGDGASAEEVQTIVSDELGTASSTGTVTSGTGTMDLPTTSVNPETGEVTTGTNPVSFGGNEVPVTETVKGLSLIHI